MHRASSFRRLASSEYWLGFNMRSERTARHLFDGDTGGESGHIEFASGTYTRVD
jgi:hypothetical protein